MSSIQSRRSSNVSKGGAALLIVLFLIILLTGLTIAFLSRSMTAVKVSSSSAGETKVGLLANSASDIIIGDLKQEIAAGSTAMTFSGGSNTLYTPVSSQTMIPFESGVPATNAATYIPNLISRSVRASDTAGTAPYVAYTTVYTTNTVSKTPPNRAADDTGTPSKVSTTTPSLNGRYISLAQWNSHYLMPRATSITAGSTNTDSTPIASFEAPDWVVMTRGGANKVTWNSTLTDSTLSNTNYVVGRYAYAVYNEGGLLDMNAAGYPAGANGLSTAQSSRKGPLPLADLSQLKAGSTTLTTAQINNIVGWRNYASSGGPAGSYGGFTFTAANSANWMTNVVYNNTNGFMKVANPATGYSGTQTDQAFLSRQQLISIAQSLAISPDFLQYLSTFSRALEQPSYVPNPNQPTIIAGALPDVGSITTYVGNNTYAGGESAINMTGVGGFLSVRVGTGFTRWNGTTAAAGEPLVKTKFALSKLAMVTSTATTTTVKAAYATTADPDPMLDRFGLTRNSTTSPWVYDHGISAGGVPSDSSHPAIIATLSQVAALTGAKAREPDMAELLKAAINVGSVGKAGPSGQGSNDQYRQDVSGDYQILQIMANLIDQQKTDNYPTWIQYTQNFAANSTNYIRNIYGDQDLPYFYRWNYFNVTTTVPSPPVTYANTVSAETSAGPPAVFKTFDHTITAPAGGNQGAASMLIIPTVWNPHDANTPVASGGGPTTFRVLATTNPPGAGSAGAWSIRAVPAAGTHFDGAPGGITIADPPTSVYSTAKPLTLANNSWLQFTDGSNGLAFREPTMLWRNNYPTGVTLTGISRKEDPSNLTGKTYFGILVGDTKVSWGWTDKAGVNYLSQTSTMQHAVVAGGAGSQSDNITFDMQYLGPDGTTWITYQEVYLESTQNDYPSYTLYVNKNEAAYASDNRWKNPFTIGQNASDGAISRTISGVFDPRTERFTAPVSGDYNNDDPTLDDNPTLEVTSLINNSGPTTGTVNDAVLASNFVLLKTDRPTTARGQYYKYTTPTRGYDSTVRFYDSNSTCQITTNRTATDGNFYNGLLSQNNPTLKYFGNDNTTVHKYYYEDPDGVARRAMGGYVAASGNPVASPKFGLTNITNQTQTIGLPLATAGTTFTGGIATPSSQSQSRPIILHRAFRSVAEMSYAFRGTPWKNIDFFTPESGDSALLDVFCVNEPPPSGLIAGKVDLNTRQPLVLKAIFSGAYRDELANLSTPPANTLPALSSTEAGNLANTLTGITTSSNAWEGPLTNIGDLVGHFVYPDPGTLTAKDVYQYTSPANNTEYTYSGFTGALGNSSNIWDSGNLTSSQLIQRFHESPIRPLADAGQVRVWNLLIDIVAQTGRYPKSATGLDQFLVDGQKRVWLHVAIDRYTGQVLDKQVEVVSQ